MLNKSRLNGIFAGETSPTRIHKDEGKFTTRAIKPDLRNEDIGFSRELNNSDEKSNSQDEHKGKCNWHFLVKRILLNQIDHCSEGDEIFEIQSGHSEDGRFVVE